MIQVNCYNNNFGPLVLCQMSRNESDDRIMKTVSILNGNPVKSIDELNYCKSILGFYQYSNLGVGQ